jgi:Predicted Zn peptidase
MQFFLDKISRLSVGWNKRPLTEDDFYKLCNKHKITVVEMPLQTGGFYYCVKRRHYIAVNSSLKQHERLLVMFHEFAHYLMHAPDTGVTANFHGVGQRTRKEAEADIFAVCALIPRAWIEGRSVHELVEEEGFCETLVRERLAIYTRNGF